MRPRAASSSGHSDASGVVVDVHASHSSFQARASKFLKDLSNFARGKKNTSDTCPYSNGSRRGQPKPYLSQPALVISDLSPEQDESSSMSPSSLSRTSPLNSAAPGILGAGPRSLDLADGGRNERARGSAQPKSAVKIRLPQETISHDGQSPNFLTLPATSPSSGRSVSFDIPRPSSNKDDKRSKPGNFETMPPHVTAHLADVPEDPTPLRMTNDPSQNLPGAGWSSTVKLLPHPSKVEGLPNSSGSVDPSLFAYPQPTHPPSADEVRNLASDRIPTHTPRNPVPSEPPNYHEATNSPVLTPGNISPGILPPKRVALLRLSSLPPAAFTMNEEDGSVRFSPTPIARHFPTSVLPLPPTSISRRSTSPAPSVMSNASNVRLRSVPALAMEGPEDGGDDGSDDDDDHMPMTTSPVSENEDDDEDDEEDDDATTERDGSSTYVSASASPVELRSDFDTSPGPVDADKTPVVRPALQDYFSIRPMQSDSVSWAASSSNARRTSLTPGGRPAALYHQPSKSMVNLMSSQRRDLSVIDEETKGKGKAPDSVSSAVAVENNVLPEGSRIQRRRSLPTFTAATEPPPYPSLEIPGRSIPRVFPRDEEGNERLPPYSNDILLFAVLPRKLEFTSPGVQARDRKWRRMLCVLEGTAFRVFEPPASVVGIGPVGRWWEKRVGVGDLTSDAPLPKKTNTTVPGSQKIDQDLDGDGGQPTVRLTASVMAPDRETVSAAKKSKLQPHGFLRSGNTSGSSSRRPSGETTREEGYVTVSASRPSFSSVSTNAAGRPSVSSYKRAASPMPTKSAQPDHVPYPQNCQALRVYTLQHAESGLASDYLKRKNVIRVRMEGEQFLLQAPSVQAVVNWIEGFQTATGIAPDLDERPMPKGPMFPRRRRRRPRVLDNPNALPAQTGERPRPRQ